MGIGEAVQWSVELSRAQAAQRQAADYLFYACLVLGRECATKWILSARCRSGPGRNPVSRTLSELRPT